MRPDKHKKRQRAAYNAKKAGKKSSRQVRAPSDTNAARTKVSSRPEHLQEDQANIGTNSKPNSSDGVKNVMGQRVASEKKNTDNSLPSFSRRKIESNWEQYEESLESDEMIDRRGADFTFLLNQTVGSDFRFKDEDSLDDSTQEDITSMLSFNCVELAQKLQSIALPERLEINRSMFDMESLEVLDQDAVTSGTMGHSEDSPRPQNDDKPVTSDGTPTDNYLDQELDDILSLTEKSRTSEMPHRTESNSSNRELLEEPSRVITSSNSEVKTYSPKDGSQTKHLECSEEDELDFLLSLNAPAVEAKSKNQDELSVKGEDKNRNPTNENCQKSENSVPVDSAAPTVSSSEIATENLDDWLDSILED